MRCASLPTSCHDRLLISELLRIKYSQWARLSTSSLQSIATLQLLSQMKVPLLLLITSTGIGYIALSTELSNCDCSTSRQNTIFWVSDNSIRMALLDITDGVATDYAPFVIGTQITSMSVDWRTSKVYWTDSAAQTIEQYDLVLNRRSTLYQMSTDSSPLGIVVDPFTR